MKVNLNDIVKLDKMNMLPILAAAGFTFDPDERLDALKQELADGSQIITRYDEKALVKGLDAQEGGLQEGGDSEVENTMDQQEKPNELTLVNKLVDYAMGSGSFFGKLSKRLMGVILTKLLVQEGDSSQGELAEGENKSRWERFKALHYNRNTENDAVLKKKNLFGRHDLTLEN